MINNLFKYDETQFDSFTTQIHNIKFAGEQLCTIDQRNDYLELYDWHVGYDVTGKEVHILYNEDVLNNF